MHDAGLWSRRSRVRVPSLTLAEAAFAGRAKLTVFLDTRQSSAGKRKKIAEGGVSASNCPVNGRMS